MVDFRRLVRKQEKYHHLPSSVKDVKETGLRVDDRALLVSVLDRRVVVVDEVVLHVLQGEGRLAHTAVTKHHYPIPGRWFRL